MRVLEVGCGTGAITLGISEAAGPHGELVGVDRDAALLALAPKRVNLRETLECGGRLGSPAVMGVMIVERQQAAAQ
jgi:tRNA A58 N-methylase Trm61